MRASEDGSDTGGLATTPAETDAPIPLTPAHTIGREVDRRRPIVPQIYDALRDAIVGVALRPGQVISETEMAASFGVSRTPIREALIRLADEGLIDIYPQAGTFVSRIDLAAVREAQFVRQTLETAVAIQAASIGVGVTAFEPILERQERAIRNGDFAEVLRLRRGAPPKGVRVGRPRGNVAPGVVPVKSHLDRVRQLERPSEETLLRCSASTVRSPPRSDPATPLAWWRWSENNSTVILTVAPDVAARHPDLFRG